MWLNILLIILLIIQLIKAYDQILINNIPNISHNSENSYFSKEYLNDNNLDTIYNSGIELIGIYCGSISSN